jgi:hypothetical protein
VEKLGLLEPRLGECLSKRVESEAGAGGASGIGRARLLKHNNVPPS